MAYHSRGISVTGIRGSGETSNNVAPRSKEAKTPYLAVSRWQYQAASATSWHQKIYQAWRYGGAMHRVNVNNGSASASASDNLIESGGISISIQ